MRRREAPETGEQMPEWLRVYRFEDWEHLVEPEPDWVEYSTLKVDGWPRIKARILFGRARSRWRREHEVGR